MTGDEPEETTKISKLKLPAYRFPVPQIYFSPLVKQAIEINEVTERLRKMVSFPAADVLAKLHQDLAPFQQLAQIQTMWASDFAKQMSHVAAISRSLHIDLEPLRQAAQESIRFISAASDHDWPPPMGLGIREMRAGLKAYETAKREEKSGVIRDAIVKGHDKEVFEEMRASWPHKEWLGKRATIMTKALDAHVRGDFELSIPALLAQIEGLVAETCGHKGRITQHHWETYVKLLYQINKDPTQYDQAAARFITGRLLQTFFWGLPVPATSRHAILHGADIDYATEENSLKIIILVADIAETCDDYRNGHAS